jgi:hypothetical protein
VATPAERFFAFVDPGDCWEWTGATSTRYGRFWDGARYVYAHRWIWEHLVCEIPAGAQIDHLCRNPPCVNPSHLDLVWPRDNVRRGMAPIMAKRRAAKQTHCHRGHPLSGDNLYLYRGARHCKQCMKRRYQAWQERRDGSKV